MSAGELHDAVKKRDLAAATIALASGADPNAYDAQGRTPLILAALGKQHEIMRALLAKRADVNKAEKSNGFTALHWSDHSPAITKTPIEAGANVRQLNTFGQFALHACHNLEVARMRVSAGTPADEADNKHGSTPLCAQAAGADVSIVDFLISLQAKVDGQSRVVPLIQAARSGRTANIEPNCGRR